MVDTYSTTFMPYIEVVWQNKWTCDWVICFFRLLVVCLACLMHLQWCPARVSVLPPRCWCWSCLLKRPRSVCRGYSVLKMAAWWSLQIPWKIKMHRFNLLIISIDKIWYECNFLFPIKWDKQLKGLNIILK